MSMPQIPEEKHRPCLKETVIDLLESIALEEIALSHLVNAEAEKIQTFIHTIKDIHSCHKHEDFIKFNTSVGKIIDTVIMKEWILLKKLESVLQIDYKDKKCKHHNHDCCEKEYEYNECGNHVKVKVKCGCDGDCECGECGSLIKVKVKCNCHEDCECNECNKHDQYGDMNFECLGEKDWDD